VANRSAKSWVFKFFDFLGDALESVRQLSFQFFAFAPGMLVLQLIVTVSPGVMRLLSPSPSCGDVTAVAEARLSDQSGETLAGAAVPRQRLICAGVGTDPLLGDQCPCS
jgi:hypothetical protein